MKLKLLLPMFFLPAFLFGNPLSVGDPAPSVTVVTHEGEELQTADAYAKGPVLVYFYPKADTAGCTRQACNIRDNFGLLRDAGVTVLGVSTDSVEDQADFQAKHELPFTLIADEDRILGKAFKVGTMMGAVYRRQSFLVVDGKIAWRDLSASPGSQAEDALAALQER